MNIGVHVWIYPQEWDCWILWSGGCAALEWQLQGTGATVRRYPTSKGKGEPQQDGRRDKIAFRIESHTHQRHSEGSNKPCAHQDPEAP